MELCQVHAVVDQPEAGGVDAEADRLIAVKAATRKVERDRQPAVAQGRSAHPEWLSLGILLMERR